MILPFIFGRCLIDELQEYSEEFRDIAKQRVKDVGPGGITLLTQKSVSDELPVRTLIQSMHYHYSLIGNKMPASIPSSEMHANAPYKNVFRFMHDHAYFQCLSQFVMPFQF
jgi:hypothetical protein